MTELRLQGQRWEVQGADQPLDTTAVFAALRAGSIPGDALCRSEDEPGWRPVASCFQIIGRFGALRELGEGAFGKVFLAFDAARKDGHPGRLVALKRPGSSLLDRLARAAGRKANPRLSATENRLAARAWASLQIGQAFSKETALTARLAMCENVVSVVDHDVTVPYLALEYCGDGDLAGRLQRPYGLDELLVWGRDIAAALAAAHGIRPDALIHRDLKPDNILLAEGRVKVSDFGTSQLMQGTESLRSLKGGYTPSYAAPEAFDERAYPETDVWSLGVILYEMLAGRRPFTGGSMIQLARKIDRDEPPPLLEAAVIPASPALVQLVTACLNKDPRARPSAEECRERLEEMRGLGRAPTIVIEERGSILEDLARWDAAGADEQDAAVAEAAEILGPAFALESTREYACGGQRHRIAAFEHRASGALLHLIPGGAFTMGAEDAEAYEDEGPARRVRLAPFLIGRFPLRQRVWDAIGGVDQRRFQGPDRPIENVSWDEVRSWLKETGDGLRLASEAEWEYAARSGATTPYFWGPAMDQGFAWFRENSAETRDASLHGRAEAWNAFGLIDTAGNVWEWCEDGWAADHRGAFEDGRPRYPGAPRRVQRGGSWISGPRYLRVSVREGRPHQQRSDDLGFRVARSLE